MHVLHSFLLKHITDWFSMTHNQGKPTIEWCILKQNQLEIRTGTLLQSMTSIIMEHHPPARIIYTHRVMPLLQRTFCTPEDPNNLWVERNMSLFKGKDIIESCWSFQVRWNTWRECTVPKQRHIFTFTMHTPNQKHCVSHWSAKQGRIWTSEVL
jgi:hypothetical protein